VFGQSLTDLGQDIGKQVTVQMEGDLPFLLTPANDLKPNGTLVMGLTTKAFPFRLRHLLLTNGFVAAQVS
jgi:hypothetical protein